MDGRNRNQMCPFCGASTVALTAPPWQDDGGNDVHTVQCDACHAEGPVGISPEQAWLRWNTRHTNGGKND